MANEDTGMICNCGLEMARNPHPDAGDVATLATVGALFGCIPCLTESRNGWAARAQKAERELDAARQLQR